MGLIGCGIGAFLGSLTRFPFGGIIGAIIGAVIEEKLKYSTGRRDGDEAYERMRRTREARNARTRTAQTSEERRRREIVFLTAASAMFAKMAKADGRVTADEIACVEEAFMRLGFTGEKRDFCISVFRKAKDDGLTIYAYAAEFASCEPQAAVRETLYSMLWDLACADGDVSAAELSILRNITMHLGVRSMLFEYESERRLGSRRSREGSRRRSSGRSGQESGAPSLREAYAMLGCSSTSTDAELKQAYREMAKQNHPDVLRARGVPEELVKKANERMARVNAAWAEIKRARGL